MGTQKTSSSFRIVCLFLVATSSGVYLATMARCGGDPLRTCYEDEQNGIYSYENSNGCGCGRVVCSDKSNKCFRGKCCDPNDPSQQSDPSHCGCQACPDGNMCVKGKCCDPRSVARGGRTGRPAYCRRACRRRSRSRSAPACRSGSAATPGGTCRSATGPGERPTAAARGPSARPGGPWCIGPLACARCALCKGSTGSPPAFLVRDIPHITERMMCG